MWIKSWSDLGTRLRYLSIHLCIKYRITQNTFLKLTREGRLTSHKGVIPPGQIWIKLGGDKGGSSMKMSFQICNLKAPNSVKITYLHLCCIPSWWYYHQPACCSWSLSRAGEHDRELNMEVKIDNTFRLRVSTKWRKWSGLLCFHQT